MAEREESRYAHLLAPIRDLSVNWHTDIAAELSDYLTQLDDVTFSFDGGKSLNFAEAALLIQGSTCVYSRKVEYLHKLVYNALEVVASKKRGAGPGEEDGPLEAEEEDEDDVAAFLALDDAVTEGQGIDLDEVAAARAAVTPRGGDAALWALCDAGAGCEAADGQGVFRPAAVAVHVSGALLLDPADAAALDEHLEYRAAPVAPTVAPDAPMDAAPPADGGWDDDGGAFDGPPDDGGPMEVPDARPTRGALAAGFEEEEEEEEDPWAPLDYNDAAGLPVKPFRKGRTQRRGTAASAPPDAAAAAARRAAKLGALFPEFGYAHEALAKRSQRERATARRAAAPAAAPVPAASESEEEADFGGDAGGGGWSDDEAAPLDVAALEAAAAAGAAPPAWADAAPVAEAGELSYEDLVRQHIEARLAAAAAVEGQSELAARVAAWKGKMEPALHEAEAHAAFDIHAAGAEVLAALAAAAPATPEGAEPQQVRFAQLMDGHSAFEVARAFAATLQLVNAGAVGLAASGDAFELVPLGGAAIVGGMEAPPAAEMDRPLAKPAARQKKSADKSAPAAKRRAAMAQN